MNNTISIGEPWMWAVFIGFVLVMLALDLYVFGGRKPHKVNVNDMLRFQIFGILLLVLAGCDEPPPYVNLDNVGLQALATQGVPVYDVRRPEEWRETGVVEGSRLITFVDANGRLNPEFLPRFAAEVGKDDPVILICRIGNRTDVLARYLVEKMGYTQVYNVRHGITRWIGDKRPVIKN